MTRHLLALACLLAPAAAFAKESCDLPYDLKASAIHQFIGIEALDPLNPASWKCARGRGEDIGPEGDADCGALKRYFLQDSIDPRPPVIGLSLAGGGSKAAAYAMGVIEGLQLSGVMPRLDYISSVSGGSYSAYYFYSRLLDRHEAFTRGDVAAIHEASAPKRWFEDSVPEVRKGLFGDRDVAPLLGMEEYFRKHPYQARIRYYADVLSPLGGWKTSEQDFTSTAVSGAALAVGHGFTMWPVANAAGIGLLASIHHVSKTLFDWPVNTSPSRWAYRRGILRAFGAGEATFDPGWDDSDRRDVVERRDFRDLDRLHTDGDFQEACVAAGAALCRPPRWIINASIAESASSFGWLEVPRRNFAANSFEIASNGFGAGKYGYVFSPHPEMSILDAVLSSAAFFDSEQRSKDDPVPRSLFAVAQHAVNANWGADWPNYNVCNGDRQLHYALPFPLYYLHRFTRDERSANIHLLDGGSVDNLGMLPLVRRRIRHIIVADSAHDAMGSFEDICRAKNELELISSSTCSDTGMTNWGSKYELRVPDLRGLDLLCNSHLGPGYKARFGNAVTHLKEKRRASCRKEASAETCGRYESAKGFSVHHWTAPVLEGCVIDVKGSQLADGRECPGGRAGSSEGGLISRLYLLKPALDLKAWKESLAALQAPAAPPGLDQASVPARNAAAPCWHPYSRSEGGPLPGADQPPCEALAFVNANLGNLRDSCPIFPQNSTVFMTFNSSFTLYGAYKDLGRYHASFIVPDDSRGIRVRGPTREASMESRSESELEQACSPRR